MVSIKQLKKQIASEKAKQAQFRSGLDLKAEKRRLQRELDLLRSPGKRRTTQAFTDIKSGFKRVGRKAGKFVVEQAKLIKEQEEREAAREKQIRKSVRKTQRRRKQKPQKQPQNDFFDGLSELNLGM